MSVHRYKVLISMNGCTKFQPHCMDGWPSVALMIIGPLALCDDGNMFGIHENISTEIHRICSNI